ncbi:MAG: F0F1 ATP synthase subunit delta [Desulfobacteraceae bacterium]|nr:F0F1 ATP synthase subunit delta [Desulfobacteraceae bacterium]MCF8094033.1 F0F1 ATP synthase subunit delta [Desulfobacteraceae bacterium]
MRSSAIARRYAKALILIGKQDGQAEKYREEFRGFIDLFDAQPAFEQTVTNPLYDMEKRKNLLDTVLERLEISNVMKSFLVLLFKKKRFAYIRDINYHYNKLADELKGIVRAELVSAAELSPDAFEQIRQSLSKMTGRDVVLESKQDSELIGGVVTKIGDLVLDGSIRTQLKNMRESLKRGESV